jgi:hypothetical protein
LRVDERRFSARERVARRLHIPVQPADEPVLPPNAENTMSLSLILLIVLVLLLIGAIPAWPHSRGWGYAPSGVLGVVLVIVIILFLTGRL